MADHPRDDLIERIEHRHGDRQQGRELKQPATRPHDDDHSRKSNKHSDPAAWSDFFTQKRYRKRCDQEWRDEGDRNRICQGHQADSGEHE